MKNPFPTLASISHPQKPKIFTIWTSFKIAKGRVNSALCEFFAQHPPSPPCAKFSHNTPLVRILQFLHPYPSQSQASELHFISSSYHTRRTYLSSPEQLESRPCAGPTRCTYAFSWFCPSEQIPYEESICHACGPYSDSTSGSSYKESQDFRARRVL